MTKKKIEYSIQREVSDGTLNRIVLRIEYLKKEDISVFVDLLPADGTMYSWEWDGDDIVITPTVPSGSEVTVQRISDTSKMLNVFDAGAVFDNSTMDENFKQLLFLAQEYSEGAGLNNVFNDIDMHGYKIRNVGNATEDNDVITFGQYKAEVNGVYQAKQDAEKAKDEAQAAQLEAETFKDEAKENSNLAKDWAIKMDGKVVEDAAEVDYSAKYWATSIKEYGVASIVVADNIDDVKQVATNIEDVKLVGGDLEGLFSPPDFTDMGRVGTGSTEQVEITGGNIKTVADNIEDVKSVGTLINSGQVQIVIDSVKTTNQNVIKAKQSEGLSKDWAIKTDGLVNNEDYSSKYYAQKAKESADSTAGSASNIEETITQAKQDISTAVTQGVSQVSSAGSTAVSNINATKDQATENLETTTQDHLSEITTAGTTQVQAVNTAGTTQAAAVASEGTKQVGLVTTEGTNQVAIIKTHVDKAQQWAEKTDGEVEAGAYSAKYWAQQAAAVGGQSDWNESDSNSLAYIKNKPDLTVYATKDELTAGLARKATKSHTHTASQVTDFTAQVQSLINSSRITDYGRVGS